MKDINYKDVKDFWDNRHKRRPVAGDLFLANLSENIPLQAFYKDLLEKRLLFARLRLDKSMRVLDLGCGTGRMAVFFARYCGKVVGVDFSASLLKIAYKQVKDNFLYNVILLQQNVLDFYSDTKFDLIFIGGVSSFLNDGDVKKLISKARKLLKEGGKLIIRESLCHRKRIDNIGKYSHALEADYNAIYRSIKDFKGIASMNGFTLEYEQSLSVFPSMGGCHVILRILFGRWKKVFAGFSRIFFSVCLFFLPVVIAYKCSRIYKVVACFFNRYEQMIFIYHV